MKMDLGKFLNQIATIFGTFEAIYVMLGILAISPELIEQQSNSYDTQSLETYAHEVLSLGFPQNLISSNEEV